MIPSVTLALVTLVAPLAAALLCVLIPALRHNPDRAPSRLNHPPPRTQDHIRCRLLTTGRVTE